MDLGALRRELFLTDWVIPVKCISHGCSNEVKWGLKAFDNKIDKTNVHVSTAALRNSKTALLAHIDSFVVRHLRWTEERSASWDDRVCFWRALDVPHDLLDIFVDMDLMWIGTDLVANAKYAADPKSLEDISSLISHCMHWKSYSETRWAAVGQSARLLVRSLAVGLCGLFDLRMEDENISKWHLSGFSKCDVSIRKFLATVAFTAFPAESVLDDLLERLVGTSS